MYLHCNMVKNWQHCHQGRCLSLPQMLFFISNNFSWRGCPNSWVVKQLCTRMVSPMPKIPWWNLINSRGGTGGLRAPSSYIFLNHIFEILRCWIFTNFFVPRANSCPMGLLSGHLGSHIEFPLDNKNRGKIGVGVTILIITSVILVYFQQMRYQNLKYSIPKIL